MSEADLGGFKPFNDAHAIYACNLSLVFNPKPQDPAAWFRTRAAALEFGKKHKIGIPKPVYGVNLNVDAERLLIAIDRPATTMAESIGYELTRLNELADVFDRLTIATNGITLHTLTYLRWQPLRDYWREALRFFANACEGMHVSGVKLEYWDIFQGDGSINTDVSKLIRANSPHIIPAAFHTTMPWKSSYERSAPTTAPVNRSIRVDVAVGNTALHNGYLGQAVMVHTAAQDYLPQPMPMPQVLEAAWPPFEWAEAQHDVLKSTLAEVISEAAIERIALRQ